MQMLPLWFQWLFAIGGIVLIVAVFLALWTKLASMKRNGLTGWTIPNDHQPGV